MKEQHPLNAPGIRPMLISAGFTSPQIGMWIERDDVPVKHCADIERITKRLVTRQDLRPDDFKRYWPELKAPKAEVAT